MIKKWKGFEISDEELLLKTSKKGKTINTIRN